MKKNIPIALPSTGEEEWLAMKESVMSGWLTQGPKVAEFEKNFAEMHEVKHAIATTSCTTALHLMLAAAGIGPGDEVIVPSFTWVATANVVLYCGATPIFADVNSKTFNITPESVEEKITPNTKAVIVVHLFGLCADVDAIVKVLPKSIILFEDAACAAGAIYKGKKAGSLGLAGAFSFHPRKPITTGEGGMITTNDDLLAEKIIMLRNHGASISEEQRHHGLKPYILPDFNMMGFNYRMTDLQGAVGSVQLKKLDAFISERARWAKFYRENLKEIEWLICPDEPPNGRHSWQAFVTYVDPKKAPLNRNEIMGKLQEAGISTRPGTHAVHMLNYYKDKYGLKETDFPEASQCDQNTMALPLHNKMLEEDYHFIVQVIKDLT